MLDSEDKKELGKMIFDQTVKALEQVILPRFDRLESLMDRWENRIDNVKNHETRIKKIEKCAKIPLTTA